MEQTPLGSGDVRISRLGFGAEPLGGYAWGRVDPAGIARAVAEALDRGVTYFDTADCYGQGLSEERLGQALGRRRADVVIGTKFGVRFDARNRAYYDNSPAWIRESAEGSLTRLGTDHIDLYQLHWPDGRTPLSAVIETLERLREAGKIRFYGVTNCDLATEHGPLPPAFASFSEEFSLAHCGREAPIRKTVDERGLTFLSWGSLGQGILSGKYGARPAFEEDDRRRSERYANFHGPRLARNLAIVATLKELSAATGRTVPQIALRWILDRIPGSAVIAGIKTRDQLRDNLGALGWRLEAEALGLLDRAAKEHETAASV